MYRFELKRNDKQYQKIFPIKRLYKIEGCTWYLSICQSKDIWVLSDRNSNQVIHLYRRITKNVIIQEKLEMEYKSVLISVAAEYQKKVVTDVYFFAILFTCYCCLAENRLLILLSSWSLCKMIYSVYRI